MARDDDPLLTAEGNLVYRACPGEIQSAQALAVLTSVQITIPYSSAKCIRLAMEFSGSISLILPKSGNPGGVGIGVPMASQST